MFPHLFHLTGVGQARIFAGVFALMLSLTGSVSATGATFTVNSTVDVVDESPANGKCQDNASMACTTDADCTAVGLTGPCNLCDTGRTAPPAPSTPECTLRAAIQEANASPGADTIDLPAGTYTLTIAGGGEDGSANGDLDITGDLALNGAGADATIVSGVAGDRVFHVDPNGGNSNVSINGVTVQNGSTLVIAFVEATGGGILVGSTATAGDPTIPSGTLTLSDCVIQGNFSQGAGGGLANKSGTLVIIRSRVSNNTNSDSGRWGGGGIVSRLIGKTTLIDSTVSNNSAADNGGGIVIAGGQVTVLNSTISGNTANGQGGGIARFYGTLTMANSTVSGNTAGDGGGIYNHHVDNGPNILNNSAIANNRSTGFVTFGASAGGIASGGPLTLSNTLVAGNTSPAGGSDCVGVLTSAGYNLIQVPVVPICFIGGDPTGNVIGQEPILGPLGDYGGPTRTHVLLAGSPAIDAGNPAAPGSGAAACAVADQRGVLRPVGATCDIGAVEREGELAINRLVPNHGGNAGPLLAVLSGNRFASGAMITLARSGEPDIVGNPVVFAGDVLVSTSFDLTGRATGPWDVVVTNLDETSTTLPGGFTIEETRAPELWINIVGRPFVRASRGPTLRYLILFGNRGNVDALGVPLGLSIPANVGFRLRFDIAPPPAHDGQVATEWNQVPVDVFPDAETGGATNLSLLLPIVPAGFTGMLEMFLTFPTTAEPGETFLVLADLDRPLLSPSLSPRAVDTFVHAAQAYAEQNLHVTIPPAVVPDLEQYITDQLTAVVTSGRAALLDSFGAPTQVYSLAQLDIDLARYGAARSEASAVSAAGFIERAANWAPSVSRVIVAALSYFGSSPAEATCPPPDECPPVIPAGCSCRPRAPGTPRPVDTPGPDNTITKDTCINLGRTVSADGKFCKSPECPDAPLNPGVPSCTGIPIKDRNSLDPNDKVGALGVDDARFLSADMLLPYAVFFENLETATAPAQEVTITDQLDVDRLDLATFSLGPISFGTLTINPPPGLSEYTAGVDLRPQSNLLVTVDARLDKATGRLTWRFASIDPDTLQLTDDPLAGFLPPNVHPPEGDGSVVFTVQPKAGLATGTEIRNHAAIVFDVNPPIDTPEWLNTIDNDAPESHVSPLAARTVDGDFTVAWSGTDNGAGIVDFTIYVSEDRGPFTAWLADTTDTSATFAGQQASSYDFFSVARDRAGNVEDQPRVADARTTVISCVGDCEGDGTITVDELVRMVRVALNDSDVSICRRGDANGDGAITVNEIVTAVNGLLRGC